MGKHSTISGYWRSRGNANNNLRPPVGPTPAVGLQMVKITFIPTQASSTVTGVTLPKGALLIGVIVANAGATGGVAPTVDIGLVGIAVDTIGNEVDADTASGALITTGTGVIGPKVALTADREITAGAGASAATGGTVTAYVLYAMNDDQSLQD